MKRTKVTGKTCVGELRLAAIDVGFDLRDFRHIKLPADFCSVGFDKGGDTWLVEGTREEMVNAILEAGYRID